MDLGPSWFWPKTQPLISRLLSELGLTAYPQHETGTVLDLADHDNPPNTLNRQNLFSGAHRLEGGWAALIDALIGKLPEQSVSYGHTLTDVADRGDYISLTFSTSDGIRQIDARSVVLAMPPRLIEEKIQFNPPLPGDLALVMRNTQTWMAARAKAMVSFENPFWRKSGLSGNAFVSHDHVVLGEIFDACNATGDQAALGGYFSLSAEWRASLGDGMPMLIASQLAQVFGLEAENGEQHVQDWANEPNTCSRLDRQNQSEHAEYGHPALRRPVWNGKLHFGGTETASYAAGYMEGALEAAVRIQRVLKSPFLSRPPVRKSSWPSGTFTDNEASILVFSEWVSQKKRETGKRYQNQLHQLLASQDHEQLTQRAVLITMEQIYSEALYQLEELAFDMTEDLATRLLSPFVGFNKALLDEVQNYNKGSCALSNFPIEHDLAGDYLKVIAEDLVAAWREFSFNVDTLMLNTLKFSTKLSSVA
jgi:monoamine oxidase